MHRCSSQPRQTSDTPQGAAASLLPGGRGRPCLEALTRDLRRRYDADYRVVDVASASAGLACCPLDPEEVVMNHIRRIAVMLTGLALLTS